MTAGGELGARGEGVRFAGVAVVGAVDVLGGVQLGLELVRGDHEAAAHGVVVAGVKLFAGVVVGGQTHAVRMPGQGLAHVQRQVALPVEGDLVAPVQGQPTARDDLLHEPGAGVRVDGLGVLAGQAEQHRGVRAVAHAGGRQRAEQLGVHAGRALEDAVLAHAVREAAGSAHGPHGVGRGRADADREQVEDAERHAVLLGCERDARWPGVGAGRAEPGDPVQTRLGARGPAGHGVAGRGPRCSPARRPPHGPEPGALRGCCPWTPPPARPRGTPSGHADTRPRGGTRAPARPRA